jgi:hypothetical protein
MVEATGEDRGCRRPTTAAGGLKKKENPNKRRTPHIKGKKCTKKTYTLI